MAILDTIIQVNWHLNPRVLLVAAPETDITVQDLYDTCRFFEDNASTEGNLHEELIDAGGKEALDDVTRVGITSTLNNAYVMFEARSTPLISGLVCDTADALGTSFSGGSQDYSSLYVGCTIFNATTAAMATVIGIDDTNDIITTFPLTGGSRDDWQVGDNAVIYPNVQCSITGGNVVAVDENGDSISPILQSPNVQIKLTSSSSATLQEQTDIRFASYDGKVTVKPSSTYTGTAHPVGTARQPVNNLADAILIADEVGLDEIHFQENYTITGGTYSDYKFTGNGRQSPTLTFVGTTLTGVQFSEIQFTGTVTSGSVIGANYCQIQSFSGAKITAYECVFEGDVELGPGESNFYSCVDGVPGIGIPNIMVHDCDSLGIWNWNGGIQLSDIVVVDTAITCMIAQGRLWVDSTCVEGNIIVKGLADLRGTTGGTTIDYDGLVTKDTISLAVWDEEMVNHLLPDTMGHQMYHQAYGDTVHIEIGGANSASGTTFPTGTTHQPCDNLDDALTIADIHFMSKIHIIGSLTVDGQDLTGRTIGADRSTGNVLTITSMVNTGVCYFEDITVSGALSGSQRFTTCVMGALTGFDGGAKNCLLTDDIDVVGTGFNYFTECDSYVIGSNYINMSIGANYLNLIKCRGAFQLNDYTGTATVVADFVAGSCILDSTCVSGIIAISGLTSLTDNSGPGCFVIDGTITERGTAEAVMTSESEGSYTHVELMRAISAALAGKLDGAGTTTVTIRDINDSKDRIVATVDDDGNRTEVVLDVSE